MKIINSILYLEYSELIDCGFSGRTLESWTRIPDPADQRRKLFAFEGLRDKYKLAVTTKYGNPYKYVANSVITQHLVSTASDIEFLNNYILPDETKLPIEHKTKYIEACKYLYLLANTRTKTVKTLGFDSMRTFNDAIINLISGNNVSLPTAYPKLKAKVREYIATGPACVVSKKFGNASAKKVKDEVSEATLLTMISHHNQFDDTFVAIKYNEWAKANDKATITAQTVGNYRKRNNIVVKAHREGSAAWRNVADKTVKQMRPSHPLALINSDDNTLDLYFLQQRIDANGHAVKNYYFRYQLYVVTDAFNDYILGYAIGETITEDLVRMAYLNAVHHVRELTGEYAYWKQIKTDSWSLKNLKPFYSQQATFTPTTVGNARGKIIEQSFGKVWHTQLRQYPNYAGHNITAGKKNNPDAIERVKRDFPLMEQGPDQIAHFIGQMRQLLNTKTGKTRQQEWLEAYNEMGYEKKRLLTDTNRLLIFGKLHQYTNEITNRGIEFTLQGKVLSYDVPTDQYVKHLGKTIRVAYDPYDLNKILAVDETQRLQILCEADKPIPMAIADMTEGDRTRLNIKLKEKKAIGQMVLDKKAEWAQIAGSNAESLLQAGVLTKEIKTAAEQNLLTPGITDVFDQDETMFVTKPSDSRDIWDKMTDEIN